MFTDMTISADLNTGFKEWLQGTNTSNGGKLATEYDPTFMIRNLIFEGGVLTLAAFDFIYSGFWHLGSYSRIVACELYPSS